MKWNLGKFGAHVWLVYSAVGTKEHNGNNGNSLKKNNTNSWCVWPDISEICHNDGIMEENDTEISILPN